MTARAESIGLVLLVGTADRDWLWSLGILASTVGVVVLVIVFGAGRGGDDENE